ncbi:MAG: sugar phosphate nucleotidyltransferase [Actinomycetota bacterium]|nr:sugar phosphate nucleotidyltransferase [Actinomycetota bacterium]
MLEHAYAVVLAGGYGERFWPASTMRRPKQLLSLLGERTMLEMAVDRLAGLIPPERVLVLTSADLVAATVERSRDLPPGNVIGEPTRRDTAAAVALACAVVKARDPEGVFCVVTADHVMGDLEIFRQTLAEGLLVAAADDVLITIGITPTWPSTAFGYVEAGEPFEAPGDVVFRRVTRFVEKPDAQTAAGYLASGDFSWNSGMFIWSVNALSDAFRIHAPALAAMIDALVPDVDTDDFPAAIAAAFEPLEKISIDYALMERADNILMAEGIFAWGDVGSWPEVAEHLPTDEHGNACRGSVESIDSTNNIVLSEGRLTALIGIEDLVIVHTDEVTLICPKSRAQDVKHLVTKLRAGGRWDSVL